LFFQCIPLVLNHLERVHQLAGYLSLLVPHHTGVTALESIEDSAHLNQVIAPAAFNALAQLGVLSILLLLLLTLGQQLRVVHQSLPGFPVALLVVGPPLF
jgi:hypothetical protein